MMPRPAAVSWLAVILVGCTSAAASQNPGDMAATVTAAQTATAAVPTPVTKPTPSPPAARQAAGASGAQEVNIVEPPFEPPQTWMFEPRQISVKVGSKLTWTNTGAVAHTATTDQGNAFDSGTIDPKATFAFTPTMAGTFAYHCTFHPWMKGTLTVS